MKYNYLYDFPMNSGIEVLDIFKKHYNAFIDTNIISVQAYDFGLVTYTIDYSSNLPKGIKSLTIDWLLICDEPGKYPFELHHLISEVFENESDTDKKELITPFFEDMFYSADSSIFKILRLFGDNEVYYHALDYFEHEELVNKIQMELDELTSNYNDMAERYESSIQFLLQHMQKLSAQPALELFNKIENKLKVHYENSCAVGYGSDENVETRWNELGKWVYDEILYAMAFSDVETDVENLIDKLNDDEKNLILHDSLDQSDLDFDTDKVILDISDLSYYFDINENFIKPMIRNILYEAREDWIKTL